MLLSVIALKKMISKLREIGLFMSNIKDDRFKTGNSNVIAISKTGHNNQMQTPNMHNSKVGNQNKNTNSSSSGNNVDVNVKMNVNSTNVVKTSSMKKHMLMSVPQMVLHVATRSGTVSPEHSVSNNNSKNDSNNSNNSNINKSCSSDIALNINVAEMHDTGADCNKEIVIVGNEFFDENININISDNDVTRDTNGKELEKKEKKEKTMMTTSKSISPKKKNKKSLDLVTSDLATRLAILYSVALFSTVMYIVVAVGIAIILNKYGSTRTNLFTFCVFVYSRLLFIIDSTINGICLILQYVSPKTDSIYNKYCICCKYCAKRCCF